MTDSDNTALLLVGAAGIAALLFVNQQKQSSPTTVTPPTVNCGPGFTYNSSTNACVQNVVAGSPPASPPPAACPAIAIACPSGSSLTTIGTDSSGCPIEYCAQTPVAQGNVPTAPASPPAAQSNPVSVPVGTTPDCGTGYSYSISLGACIPISGGVAVPANCAAGYTWSTQLSACVSIPSPFTASGCPPGYEVQSNNCVELQGVSTQTIACAPPNVPYIEGPPASSTQQTVCTACPAGTQPVVLGVNAYLCQAIPGAAGAGSTAGCQAGYAMAIGKCWPTTTITTPLTLVNGTYYNAPSGFAPPPGYSSTNGPPPTAQQLNA